MSSLSVNETDSNPVVIESDLVRQRVAENEAVKNAEMALELLAYLLE